MSDLFCAARVFHARHAEAEYVEDWFSDEGGTLTAQGRSQAAALGESLRGERIAGVWSSDTSRAVQTAEIAAAALGVPVVTRKTLREVDIGDLRGTAFDLGRLREIIAHWHEGDLDVAFPGGESGHDAVRRYAGALEEIADLHRGEGVLVVGHESVACAALPHLARGLPRPRPEASRRLDHAATVELEGDADGWVIHRWADLELSARRRP